jgi:redox-sensitive bicupin YhaK (pirin superfamily)
VVELEAHEDAHVLLFGGEPIDEPVVQYGPFVMTSRQEIVKAVSDFQSGAFGSLT